MSGAEDERPGNEPDRPGDRPLSARLLDPLRREESAFRLVIWTAITAIVLIALVLVVRAL